VAVQQRTLLILTTFLLLFGNLLTFGFLVFHYEPAITGRAGNVATAAFCINQPPTFIIPCSPNMTKSFLFTCQLNASDHDNNSVVFFDIYTSDVYLNLTVNGSFSLLPNKTHVGGHTALFYAEDNSGCGDNRSLVVEYNYTVFNFDEPPVLVEPIPDQKLKINTTLSFFLSDYFYDPNVNSTLNYTFTAATALPSITILPTSEVVIAGVTCNEAGTTVVFTATNTANQSTNSNPVLITVTCKTDTGAGGGTSTGGGGGGGGPTNLCKEDWECDPWFPCLPTNIQWQRCFDHGGCRSDQYFKRACQYEGPVPLCKENWLCEEWGKCYINSTQYRKCDDLQKCGTNLTQPPLVQKCNYEPTCNDGVKNGDEAGVDCGGSKCQPCPIIEQPSLVKQPGLPLWLLLLILFSILLVTGIARYYRAQIAQLIAILGFAIQRPAYKDILLDAAQRKSVFERIRAFEQLLQTPAGKQMSPGVIYTKLATLVRHYYVDALQVHLEAVPEEVAARCKDYRLRPETTSLLTGMFAKLPLLEQEELDLDEFFVLATVEELRTAVCLTSDYQHEELLRPIEEIVVNDKMSFYDEVFVRAINALRASQFNQHDIARKEYLTILTRYEPLSDAEKEQIYPELKWTFDVVKFSSEITGAKMVKKPVITET